MNEICVARPNHFTEGEVREKRQAEVFQLNILNPRSGRRALLSSLFVSVYFICPNIKKKIASMDKVTPPPARGARRHE